MNELPNQPTVDANLAELGVSRAQLPLNVVPFSSGSLLSQLPSPPPGKVGWPWTVESSPPKSKGPWPRITIVTPSYQQGPFLEQALRSVLLQNYPCLEFIVLDGGSNDESAAIIEKYRPWLSFSRSARDGGHGHAINLGFSLSTGDLQGWLNSDDFYLPDAFAKLADASVSGDDFYYGDCFVWHDNPQRCIYQLAPWVTSRYLRFGGLIYSHSAFWRRVVHVPIWEAMRCNVDGELWQRLIPGKRLRYIPAPLGTVRIQPNAKTIHSRFLEDWRHDDKLIWGIHGRPPGPRSPVRYEYRTVQQCFKFLRRSRGRAEANETLAACAWDVSLETP
jgi:glycosyltransferase involved in cell wall biosynthesis